MPCGVARCDQADVARQRGQVTAEAGSDRSHDPPENENSSRKNSRKNMRANDESGEGSSCDDAEVIGYEATFYSLQHLLYTSFYLIKAALLIRSYFPPDSGLVSDDC